MAQSFPEKMTNQKFVGTFLLKIDFSLPRESEWGIQKE